MKLIDVKNGLNVRILTISAENKDVLKKLSDLGILIGAIVKCEKNCGGVIVSVKNLLIALNKDVASGIEVCICE